MKVKRLMKITDFFSSSKSSPNTGKESPVSISDINNKEQQEKNMSHSGNKGSITIQTPRKKRERFTDPELHKLVDTILAHNEQLFGPKALNASGKAAIWDKVVKEVNKVGGMRRTNVECKKRWMDYKRKIKQIIDNLKMQSMGGQMLPLSEIFSRRQIIVAQVFKMDVSDGQKNEQDGFSSDIGQCVSSNENVLTPSYIIDSEEEFLPSQNKSFSSSACMPSTSHQAYEEPQAASEPGDPHTTKAVDVSIPPHTTTESQQHMETQIDQLVAQQKNIFEVLQSIQKNVTASLNIQNKMYSLVKGSFLELQKTVLSSQKATNDNSSILELRLNSLHAKLDELNSVLRVKQLQEIMSSDESELNASGTQDTRSNPTATCTPATTHAPKKNTPARKRALEQSPSPADLIKKIKKI